MTVAIVERRIPEHIGALRKLLQKYRDTPMSLADAYIVCMDEIHDRHSVLTLDSDFLVYRRRGRASLPLIHPAARWALVVVQRQRPKARCRAAMTAD